MYFQQYELVRVRKLLRLAEEYDGWQVNRRAPEVGDTGCVVDILSAVGLPDMYVVESVEPDGMTVWLGDFSSDEIETIATQPAV